MKIMKCIAGLCIASVFIAIIVLLGDKLTFLGWSILTFMILTTLNIIKTPCYYNGYSSYINDIKVNGLINPTSKWCH